MLQKCWFNNECNVDWIECECEYECDTRVTRDTRDTCDTCATMIHVKLSQWMKWCMNFIIYVYEKVSCIIIIMVVIIIIM